MKNALFNLLLAVQAVADNSLRSLLTALGIVFGVAAVIAMTAIGNGSKQAILEQMKLVGANNIEIKSLKPDSEGDKQPEVKSGKNTGDKEKHPFSKGLTLADAESIANVLTGVEMTSPEIVINTNIVRGTRLEKGKCVGVANDFFDLNGLELESGMLFQKEQIDNGMPVCIIGQGVLAQFFSSEGALGQKIKCGDVWLTVIGVLDKRFASKQSLEKLGIRDYNKDVFIPVNTALIRFQDRSLAPIKQLSESADYFEGEAMWTSGGEPQSKAVNYNQLDRLVVRVKESSTLTSSADVILRLLERRHNNVADYEVTVPELLLKQQQKAEERMNLALIAIAGISLLVGGIGIMNIMLASVLERIKEIGVRRSLGATRRDIVLQFLFESVIISLAGGLIGVMLGLALAYVLREFFGIDTIVPLWSIMLSFGVATAVGLIFGIFPARKAAFLDPITALRTD